MRLLQLWQAAMSKAIVDHPRLQAQRNFAEGSLCIRYEAGNMPANAWNHEYPIIDERQVGLAYSER